MDGYFPPDMSNEKDKFISLVVVLLLIPMVVVGCGGTDQAVSVRAKIDDIRLAADGERVVSIKIKTEAGKAYDLSIGDQIDQTVWGLPHLQGHKRFGNYITVKYQNSARGREVVELSD